MQARNRNNITNNVFDLDPTPFHKERLSYMKERGPGCFDAAYYASQDENYDVHVRPYLARITVPRHSDRQHDKWRWRAQALLQLQPICIAGLSPLQPRQPQLHRLDDHVRTPFPAVCCLS